MNYLIFCLLFNIFHIATSFSPPSSLILPVSSTTTYKCPTSTLVQANTNHSGSQETNEQDTASSQQQQEPTFILPIFPLGKRVKFPTERLKLTLWEERYKALARYVLDHPTSSGSLLQREDNILPIFGALYCSHKAQIIKGGNSPITPVVEPNDVGILCCVTSSQVFVRGGEEAAELNRKDEEEDVEKIRLWGLGIGRFRVVKVLSTGYQNDDIMENGNQGRESSLPFILVDAVLHEDVVREEHGKEDLVLVGGRLEHLLHRLDVTCREEILSDIQKCKNRRSIFHMRDENEQQKQEQEMISLALTSRLEASAPAMEMLEMLRTTSTKERVDYLERKFPQQTNSFWSMDKFRMLFQ